MAEKNWIKGAIKHPGAFTAQAKQRGLSTMVFGAKVKANPEAYDKTTVRRANLAMTLSNIAKGRK